ncbi:MAG TPA: HAMP domain-containing sensor histidine kinase [Mesorhizobium sp.]|jgi:two-component system cell cycle sensor histidine kinase PleC|nr:HAMP domain-containing sensor histidine kinase [Mesorhizobium sp.]
MALHRSGTPDKNIVDRRHARRNTEVAQTIRRARERLSQQAGTAAYDAEFLRIHADASRRGAPVMAGIAALVALALWRLGMAPAAAFGWGLAAGLLQLAPILPALLFEREDEGEGLAFRERFFLASHMLAGAGWVALTLSACEACQPGLSAVVKAAGLTVAMAAMTLTGWALRGALVAGFVPPVALFAVQGLRQGSLEEAALGALTAGALPFLMFVARNLRQSALAILCFRSEKDALIAELETAKSMSDEARERAEEANLAKSRFLASMSHELRTPLNAILGFSEVMAGEVLGPIHNPTYREYARDIHQSGQHLLDLINEILDLSRIEAGRYQLHEEPVVLTAVVEDCCRMFEIKARNKDLKIAPEFERGLPRLFADARAVRQIVLNLLSNAVKFAPTGSEIAVRVGWTAGGGQYVSIKDRGPGIPADEIPVVLSAFGQGSIAIKSAEQGTGLGLPIVQKLLTIHGGSFELRSKLREGTEALALFPPNRVMEALPAFPVAGRAGGRR